MTDYCSVLEKKLLLPINGCLILILSDNNKHAQLQVRHFFQLKILIVSYFSTKAYVVVTHQKCLTEALLMSTSNMFSWRNKKNMYLICPLTWRYKRTGITSSERIAREDLLK